MFEEIKDILGESPIARTERGDLIYPAESVDEEVVVEDGQLDETDWDARIREDELTRSKQTPGPSSQNLPMAHSAKGAPDIYDAEGHLKTPPMAASSRRGNNQPVDQSKIQLSSQDKSTSETGKVVIMNGREIPVHSFGIVDDDPANPYKR